MAIREGRWDCPTCGSVGLLGRQVSCTGCGNPRPDEVRFYLPTDAEEIADAAQLSQAGAGADWICEHCGASARASETRCPGCGADRGESTQQEGREYTLAEVPRSGEKPRPAPIHAAMGGGASPPRPPRRRSWRVPLIIVGILGLLWWFLHPREVTATVAAKEWARGIEVQESRRVQEEDWNIPPGGRQLRSFRAIRDHRQVLDHYETRTREVSDRVQTGTRTYTCGQRDLGNGYFEDVTCTEPEYETRSRSETYREPIYRSEPVYDLKYAYEITRWVPDDTTWARGDGRREPSWPDVSVGANERQGSRIERYVLRFEGSDGRNFEREVPLAEFQRLRQGDEVQLKVSRSGQVELVGIGNRE